MHIQGVALPSEAGVIVSPDLAGIGAIDAFGIPLHPLSDFIEDAHRLFRYGAVRLRTDIQEIVSGIASAGDQVSNNLGRCFPSVVSYLITPTIIQGHAGFPCTIAGFGGDALFRSREVTW